MKKKLSSKEKQTLHYKINEGEFSAADRQNPRTPKATTAPIKAARALRVKSTGQSKA